MSQPKNVNLYVIDAVKVEGEHYGVGEVLIDVEPELAKELTGAGRTRLAADDEVAKAKKKARVEA